MILATFFSALLMNASATYSAEATNLSVLFGNTYYGKMPLSRCQVGVEKSGKDVIFTYQEGRFFTKETIYVAKNAASVFEKTAPPVDFDSDIELEFKEAQTNQTIYVKPSFTLINHTRTETIDAFQVLDKNGEIEVFCEYMH